jgi:hypothetical protein
MFKDRDQLAWYRLLEFPNETAQSWPIATSERRKLSIRPSPVARDGGRSADGAKKIAA